jgi:hypothetical protein
MSEDVTPGSLVGVWTQVNPGQSTVLILSADRSFELECPAPDLAGQPMSSRAFGGEWTLTGNRLHLTLRVTSRSCTTEAEIEYVVIDCGERLRLRDLETDETQILEFERLPAA